MRQMLVTKFSCAACGSNLNLTYDKPKNSGGYVVGEPTGADMVQQVIAIEPCRKCIKPLEDIKNALAVLRLGADK